MTLLLGSSTDFSEDLQVIIADLGITQMAGKPLWDCAKEIVLEMRGLIQSGCAECVKKSQVGWQYPLLDKCKAMKADMETYFFQDSGRSIYKTRPSYLAE